MMKSIQSFLIYCCVFLASYSFVSAEKIENDYQFASDRQIAFEDKNHWDMQNDRILNDSLHLDQNSYQSYRRCGSCHNRSHKNKIRTASAPLGVAAFQVTDSELWYSIDTSPYPITVLLSQNRNTGSTQGNIQLTPNGLLIGEAGNYSVSFTAVLQNPSTTSSPLIPVFLTLNGITDPTQAKSGSVVVLSPGLIGVAQGTTILENVVPGTTVSLLATNASGESQPINIVAWAINLFKITSEDVIDHHQSSN